MANKELNASTVKSSEIVVQHIKSCANKQEFDTLCKEIQKLNKGQLPVFWFKAVIASGVSKPFDEEKTPPKQGPAKPDFN